MFFPHILNRNFKFVGGEDLIGLFLCGSNEDACY